MPNVSAWIAIDVHAHLEGGVAILSRRAHRPAELRSSQKEPEDQRRRQADGRDQQVRQPDAHAARR